MDGRKAEYKAAMRLDNLMSTSMVEEEGILGKKWENNPQESADKIWKELSKNRYDQVS